MKSNSNKKKVKFTPTISCFSPWFMDNLFILSDETRVIGIVGKTNNNRSSKVLLMENITNSKIVLYNDAYCISNLCFKVNEKKKFLVAMETRNRFNFYNLLTGSKTRVFQHSYLIKFSFILIDNSIFFQVNKKFIQFNFVSGKKKLLTQFRFYQGGICSSQIIHNNLMFLIFNGSHRLVQVKLC